VVAVAVVEPRECCPDHRPGARSRAWWVYSTIDPLTDSDEQECREHAQALTDASMGRADSVADKTPDGHYWAHLKGARAERAFANFWRVPWPKRINDFESPDFDEPFTCEIRGTAGEYKHLMPLRRGDFKPVKVGRPYVHIMKDDDNGKFYQMGYVRPIDVADLIPSMLPNQTGKTPARWVPYKRLHYFPYHRILDR